MASMLRIKIERMICRAFHWRHRTDHNGFGWTGFRCKKCGYMFFQKWED